MRIWVWPDRILC